MPAFRPRNHPVNAPTPVNGPILVAPYDKNWPMQFERERQRIQGAIGERALAIEHIGSTSIPGLAAKPIIDILLVVADCTDENAYISDLEAAGFVLRIREPVVDTDSAFHGDAPHRVFKGLEIDLNLHVWSLGSVEIQRHLAFRDWLRTHPEDVALYETTKRKLAARTWANVQQYADAKTEVIEEIRARASTHR